MTNDGKSLMPFLRDVRSIIALILALTLLVSQFWAYTPWKIRGDLDHLGRSLDRLAAIVEWGTIAQTEPQGSAEQIEALAQLKKLNRARLQAVREEAR